MAKRFTDTKKWEDPWFFSLSSDDKLLWMYLLDQCDYAGIYKVNLPLACVFLKREMLEKEILTVFDDRIIVVNGGGKWFIPKFISFQYGILSPNQVMHRKVIHTLESLKSGLSKSYLTLQEEEQEEEEEEEKGKEHSIYIDIISDLNKVCGTSYKHTGAKTRVLIKARVNEGFTVEDFKKVHRNKQKEWGNDEKFCKFLRPETLYSNKFEGYLNQLKTKGSEFREKYNVDI